MGVTLDYPPSLTANMHVIGKSSGTNALQNPPASSHRHCHCPRTVCPQHHRQNESASATPLLKILCYLPAPFRAVSYEVIAPQLQAQPSTLAFMLLRGASGTHLSPWPAGCLWGSASRRCSRETAPWRREKGLAPSCFVFCGFPVSSHLLRVVPQPCRFTLAEAAPSCSSG